MTDCMISCGERHGTEQWVLEGKWRADTEDLSSTSESSKTQDESPKTKRRRKRNYSSEYLSLGFTSVRPEDNHVPVSVLCLEVRANKALKSCKLCRHLETVLIEV